MPEEPLINLTPLIDVVFVVLISFMLVAPFLQMDKVLLAPGIKEQGSASPTSPLTLAIHADNSLFWNNRPLSLAELPSLLARTKKENPACVPQLMPDSRSQFAIYQQVKNALEQAGFSQMEVLLKEP
ncbi:MAG: biopolymer transporter ExbD [Verrucomicrobiota bacterium]|nr:biopolymer transporter ExbD [Verrucomicrobiota bacterium]